MPGPTWTRRFLRHVRPHYATPSFGPIIQAPQTPSGTVGQMHRTGGNQSINQALTNVQNHSTRATHTPLNSVTGLSTTNGNTLVVIIAAFSTVNANLTVTNITDSSNGVNQWQFSTLQSNQNPPVGGAWDGSSIWGTTLIGVCFNAVPVTTVQASLSGVASTFYLGVSEFSCNPGSVMSISASAATSTPSASVASYTTPAISPTAAPDVLMSIVATASANQCAVAAGSGTATWNLLTLGGVVAGDCAAWAIGSVVESDSATYTSAAQIFTSSCILALTVSPASAVIGGTGITWRVPQQISRAIVRNTYVTPPPNGETQPVPALPHQRDIRQRSRAVWAKGYGVGYVATLGKQPLSTRQPRRTSARAVTRSTQTYTYFTGGQTQPITAGSPVHQRDLRQRHRGLVKASYTFEEVVAAAFNNGTVQPLTTLPHQRDIRQRHRGLINFGTYAFEEVVQPSFYNGQVQPQPTRQPRRTTARAVIRSSGNTYTYHTGGQVQPKPTHPEARRRTARAVWSSNPGIGQPGSYFVTNGLVRRRTSARAVIKFIPAYLTGATITPTAIACAAIVPTPTIGAITNGVTQPRASVPVPRRTSARGVWHGYEAFTYYTGGQTQPVSAQPHQRDIRQRPRAVIRTTQVYSYHTGGQIQARSTVPVPRRYPSRAITRNITQPNYYNGKVQPRAAQPNQRNNRQHPRATWAKIYGVGYVASFVNQPLSTRQPRRYPSRAYIRMFILPITGTQITPAAITCATNIPIPGITTSAVGTRQPLSTRQPRRTSSRAVVRRVVGPWFVQSTPLHTQWNVTATVDSSPVEIQWNVGGPGPGRDQSTNSQNIIYNMDQNPHMNTKNMISMMPQQPKMSEKNQIPMQGGNDANR